VLTSIIPKKFEIFMEEYIPEKAVSVFSYVEKHISK
jgi:hypothetical protein